MANLKKLVAAQLRALSVRRASNVRMILGGIFYPSLVFVPPTNDVCGALGETFGLG